MVVRYNALFPTLAALLAVLLTVGADQPPPEKPRLAVAKLTKEVAHARAARVRDVSYSVSLEIDGQAPQYTGEVHIGFRLADEPAPARALTIDFAGGSVASVRVNDVELDADDSLYNGYFITVPAAALRSGENTVDVAFSHPYSRDGRGLYRFQDPLDDRYYLYTDFEPFEQNRLFPSFDQPDLKARFSTQVTVPADWQVISIVPESDVAELAEKRRWTFPESPPVSTYIYALHAGHYRAWQSNAGDIPLRLFARQSIADQVRPEHWFIPTQQGFAFFQGYFNIPYPFGKYDQVIVPHFNAGAMENVGAVTFSERFLRRGVVTRQARRSLASVILHEMAHMWFGNLVTMDWWNGLWLNESFATFMANLAMVEATEFTDNQLRAFRSTVRAYRADERDTTHPIEMPTPDTEAALANFDAITYNKGSATLAQLRQLVGPEAFRVGVGNYLRANAYGNTTIDDFLNAISAAAERDLALWSTQWLHTPGANSVAVEFDCEGDAVTALAIVQDAPAEWPTLRTHRSQLGLYSLDQGEVSVTAVPATYAGARSDVAAAQGLPCPDFVYANHGDWDYARVSIHSDALSALGPRLAEFHDPLTRSMLWQGVYDMVLDQRLTPAAFVDFVLAHAADEETDEITAQILSALQGAWAYERRLAKDPARLKALGTRIENYLWQSLESADSGSDRQLLLFDNYIGAAVSEAAVRRLADLLESTKPLQGLDLDQDRRWSVLLRLAGLGHPQLERLLDAERKRDPSDQGRRSALSVLAAQPLQDLQRLFTMRLLNPASANPALTVADARAIARGLFPIEQQAMQLAVAEDVLKGLQAVSDTVDQAYFGAVTGGLLGTICDARYLDLLNRAITASASLHPSLHKRLLDMRFDVERCLAIGEYVHE